MAVERHEPLSRALKGLRVCDDGCVGIHGVLYDVGEFAARHPGGEMCAAGANLGDLKA